MKGAITGENYRQLFYSLDGDLVDVDDDFYYEPDSPLLSGSEATNLDRNTEVDMGCRIETIEQVTFSGLGPQNIVPDTVAGRPPVYDQTVVTAVPTDTDTDVDWDSMITESSLPTTADGSCSSSTNIGSCGGSMNTSFSMAMHPRNQAIQGLDSCPPPEQFKLAEAHATPMNALECAFCTGRGDYHEVNCQSAQGPECAFCEGRLNCHEAFCRSNPPFSPVSAQDPTLQVDDDMALAAAAEVMTLEPPSWPSSSSESSDDEDDSTFANNDWVTAETRRGWAPQRSDNEQLQAPDREWTRCGAISCDGDCSGI